MEQRNAELIRKKQANYEENYVPQELDLISALDDVSIVDEAKQNTNRTFDLRQQNKVDNLRRYGLSPNASEQRVIERGTGVARSLNYDQSVNDSRIDQESRNTSLRNSLINIGRGINSDATDAFSSAANRENDRNNAYSTAKAQHSAQNKQTAASLGALALMVMI